MEERRKYIRLDTRLKITYTILQSSKSAIKKSETKDISGGGIRIFLAEQLPLNTVLQLHIQLPEDPAPVTCKGKIAWIEEFSILQGDKKEGDVVEAGVEFTDIASQDRDRVIKHVILGYATSKEA